MPSNVLPVSWLVALCCSTVGCLSVPGTRVETLDRRKVEFALVQRGAPSVIFESGLGGTIEWWGKVFPGVSSQHTAFAYSRAGLGNSAAVEGVRDGETVVEELRRVLKEKGVAPPYVLVGHSLGGLYLQWFARRYPGEVTALVLVDSTHPEQLRGDGAVAAWPEEAKQALASLPVVPRAEFDGLDATGQSVLALPTYEGKVLVLSAEQPMKDDASATARDSNRKRVDLVKLYPNATQHWVNSSHAIPLEAPEAVIDAVREALE